MNTNLRIVIIATFSFAQLQCISQSISQTYSVPEGYHIYANNIHQKDGAISLLQKSNSSNIDNFYYTYIDSSQKISSVGSDKKLGTKLLAKSSVFDKYYYTPKGSDFIFLSKDGYYNINNKTHQFSSLDLNGQLEEKPKYSDLKNRWVDVVSREFATDTHMISIGRKTGKENRKKGKFEEIEIYIYKKNLSNLEESYSKLKLPEGYWFAGDLYPNLLYQNNDFFILKYTKEGNKKLNNYHILKFDYNGNLISKCNIESRPSDDNEKFAILNYGKGAFTTFYRDGGNSQSPIYRANINSFGAIQYNEMDDSFYLVSGLEIDNEDDGFLVRKYDSSGKLLWETKQVIPESKLSMINSYNRYIDLDVAKDFVGISFYTKKGARHCSFYLLNKSDGNIIFEKSYENYDFYKVNGLNDNNYSGLYSRFILKDEFSERIKLDRQSILSTIYDDNFRLFINKFVENGEDQTIATRFSSLGTHVIKAEKKNPQIDIYSFSSGQ